ncbi:MAG: endonuclease/exonuclease/phosphatase family protein [Planctomycetota bacterium]|jgi:endonuclease/exonuclease/phosphatase family metal-dependent hydrolase
MNAQKDVGNDPVRLRVASYNVLFGQMATARRIGEMFRTYDLDIICFCEVPGGTWTAEVGELLGMRHCYVGNVPSACHKDKYKSILSRTPLDGMLETEPMGAGWYPRTLVRAETVVRGVPITVYSLHVPGLADASDEVADDPRDSVAGYIASNIVPAEEAAELIMMGDYNDRLGGGNLKLMARAGMRSTWSDLDLDLTNSFTFSQGGLGVEHSGVIDHIFYRAASGTKAVAGGIIELDPPLSDHKPIWAELVLGTAGAEQ